MLVCTVVNLFYYHKVINPLKTLWLFDLSVVSQLSYQLIIFIFPKLILVTKLIVRPF